MTIGSAPAQDPAKKMAGKGIVIRSSGKQSGARQSGVQPGDDKQGAKKSDAGTGDQAKDQPDGKEDAPPEPKVIRRESTQNDVADPGEFSATVGEDGKVAFAFRNQPWVDLVQWLADISDQPLDWLELPGDRVNLRSPGRYTVQETRDLFNRYLLARGYTLLDIDGGLTVAKIKTVNPAIVPRVAPEQLTRIPPHSFVRTSLDIGWLSAEKLSKELKPMISANGQLTALTTTNRIEAMDAAINLGQIYRLLNQESDDDSRRALAPEFKLQHIPAEEAKALLEKFLGVEKKEAAPLTPQQIQQLQRAQRSQSQGGDKPPAGKDGDKVSIVANVRQNSVLIRAAADQVAIAAEFIKRIDVPSGDFESFAEIQSRVQVFRLASLDPSKLAEIVSEMNVLLPTTRMRVDKDNNALIVSGAIADRVIIKSLIERLDGSGRQFEVLPLRRLDPIEVAESISFLMGQKEEDKQDTGRRRYSYYGGGSDSNEDESKQDEFRVAANTRLQQVLLWANEQEMKEVRSLLVKLGELPPPGGSKQRVRLLDASATPEMLQYLKQLQLRWNQVSPNPLILPAADQFTDPNRRVDEQADEELDSDEQNSGEQNSEGETKRNDQPKSPEKQPSKLPDRRGPGDDSLASNISAGSGQAVPRQNVGGRLTSAKAPQEDDDLAESPSSSHQAAQPSMINSLQEFDRRFGQVRNAQTETRQTPNGQRTQNGQTSNGQTPSPIQVQVDQQGNLMLISPDTEALDQLESLMLQVKPPKRPYQVFHIENSSAAWMKTNLETFFKDFEDKEESDSANFFRFYWGGGSSDQKKKKPTGLGKNGALKIVSDIETNTLVVSNATAEQLQTISELIELWDVPEPVNKRKTRYTQLVSIQYGVAEKIAETVKEAYRDLLSSNDKTFQQAKQGQRGQGSSGSSFERSRDGSGSKLEDSQSGRGAGDADFSFKGKLSIGVDSVGNTLLVSAEGEQLMSLVKDMIERLDVAAQPEGDVSIVGLETTISGSMLRAALQAINDPDADSNSQKQRDAAPKRSGDNSRRQRSRDNDSGSSNRNRSRGS